MTFTLEDKKLMWESSQLWSIYILGKPLADLENQQTHCEIGFGPAPIYPMSPLIVGHTGVLNLQVLLSS